MLIGPRPRGPVCPRAGYHQAIRPVCGSKRKVIFDRYVRVCVCVRACVCVLHVHVHVRVRDCECECECAYVCVCL